MNSDKLLTLMVVAGLLLALPLVLSTGAAVLAEATQGGLLMECHVNTGC